MVWFPRQLSVRPELRFHRVPILSSIFDEVVPVEPPAQGIPGKHLLGLGVLVRGWVLPPVVGPERLVGGRAQFWGAECFGLE